MKVCTYETLMNEIPIQLFLTYVKIKLDEEYSKWRLKINKENTKYLVKANGVKNARSYGTRSKWKRLH